MYQMDRSLCLPDLPGFRNASIPERPPISQYANCGTSFQYRGDHDQYARRERLHRVVFDRGDDDDDRHSFIRERGRAGYENRPVMPYGHRAQSARREGEYYVDFDRYAYVPDRRESAGLHLRYFGEVAYARGRNQSLRRESDSSEDEGDCESCSDGQHRARSAGSDTHHQDEARCGRSPCQSPQRDRGRSASSEYEQSDGDHDMSPARMPLRRTQGRHEDQSIDERGSRTRGRSRVRRRMLDDQSPSIDQQVLPRSVPPPLAQTISPTSSGHSQRSGSAPIHQNLESLSVKYHDDDALDRKEDHSKNKVRNGKKCHASEKRLVANDEDATQQWVRRTNRTHDITKENNRTAPRERSKYTLVSKVKDKNNRQWVRSYKDKANLKHTSWGLHYDKEKPGNLGFGFFYKPKKGQEDTSSQGSETSAR